MNVNKIKRQFQVRAKTLSAVMTKNANVKVTISGSQAYRIPGLINLPMGDFTDPEWRDMLMGWIDHELGHEAHTDHESFKSASSISKLHKNFLNIIEDVRMEVVVMSRFRGARINLTRLVELAIKRELFCDPALLKTSISLVQALCLYHGRVFIADQEVLKGYAESAYQLCCGVLGVTLTDAIVSQVMKTKHATNTADAKDISDAIMVLLEEELEKQKKNSEDDSDDDTGESSGDSEDDSDDDTGESSGDSEDDSDDDTGESSGDSEDDSDDDSDDDAGESSGDSEDDSDDDAGESSGDSEDDSDDDAGESSGDSEDDSDDDTGESSGDSEDDSDDDTGESSGDSDEYSNAPSSEDVIKVITEILNSGDEDQLKDFHDALCDLISEDADEDIELDNDLSIGSFAKLSKVNSAELDPNLIDIAAAKLVSGQIYQTMNKVIYDQVQSMEIPRKTGNRIFKNRLSGIPAGNLSVFCRHAEQQDITAAVSILIDASGSMHNNNLIFHANSAALALSMGLVRCGVPNEVAHYGVEARPDCNGYNICKQFDGTIKPYEFALNAYGSTPSGEAMTLALTTLVQRPERKKLLIIITDGEPDCVKAVEDAHRLATTFGVRVVPIGIGLRSSDSTVGGFNEGEFVSINDINELAPALRLAVKTKLF